MINKIEFGILWDYLNTKQRFDLVSKQINVWLPSQYHDFEFVNKEFDKLPGPVVNWLLKYYKKDYIINYLLNDDKKDIGKIYTKNVKKNIKKL